MEPQVITNGDKVLPIDEAIKKRSKLIEADI